MEDPKFDKKDFENVIDKLLQIKPLKKTTPNIGKAWTDGTFA